MLTVIMKNFSRQVSNDLIGKLVVLPVSHQSHKLTQRLGQIVLRIKQMDDFRCVLSQHVLHLRAVLFHATLHHIEQKSFDLRILDVVWIFEHIKACSNE